MIDTPPPLDPREMANLGNDMERAVAFVVGVERHDQEYVLATLNNARDEGRTASFCMALAALAADAFAAAHHVERRSPEFFSLLSSAFEILRRGVDEAVARTEGVNE